MDAVATISDTTRVITQTTEVDANHGPEVQPVLRLRLKKPKKTVDFQAGTVDNEHMGKKKSKCCCIYKKPLSFGESSSEDEEDCENCFGHPEKRRKNRKHDHDCGGDGGGDDKSDSPKSEEASNE